MEVIGVVDHELMTYESIAKPSEDDMLKIAVINRYTNTPIQGIAHVRGFGLIVIPELKLSDRGLFDGRDFHFISPCGQR